MSGFLMRRIRSTLVFIVNHFLSGTHYFSCKRKLLNMAGITVGNGTKIVGPIKVSNCSDITIGENCWIGTGFAVYGDGTVNIGNNCDFGPEVALFTGTHVIGNKQRRAGTGYNVQINIGNGCWIGGRSSIFNEITIGNACVVGAASLVNKTVEENTIVAGVPAKIIKKLEE